MDTVPSPYPGLRSFGTEDAPYYFGRRTLIEKLAKMVSAPDEKSNSAFVGIIGESGTGKSSLVRAGLLPALSRDDSPGGQRRFGVIRPGNNILDNICEALARAEIGPREEFRNALKRGDTHTLRSAIQSSVGREPRQRFLLVLDQFEEVFAYQHDQSADSEACRSAFQSDVDHDSEVMPISIPI